MVRQAKNLTIVLTINTIKQVENNGLNCYENQGFYMSNSDFSGKNITNANHGVQEALSSNLSTRTKKVLKSKDFRAFFALFALICGGEEGNL
jgi:hypothetical protein